MWQASTTLLPDLRERLVRDCNGCLAAHQPPTRICIEEALAVNVFIYCCLIPQVALPLAAQRGGSAFIDAFREPRPTLVFAKMELT
jgi:hypothetical protein